MCASASNSYPVSDQDYFFDAVKQGNECAQSPERAIKAQCAARAHAVSQIFVLGAIASLAAHHVWVDVFLRRWPSSSPVVRA